MSTVDERIAAVLALNNAHAQQVSVLDEVGLRALLRQAFYAPVIGNVDAFLIALDETAEYGSPNFAWFQARYARFAYVDRLVVSPAARGRGLARQMYAGLFQAAANAKHTVVLCEVNQDPPNPASDALHAALGFQGVGEATVYGGSRTVRYMARQVPA